MRSLDPCVCLCLMLWKPLVCSLVTEAGMKQGVHPTMEIPSSVCGYLSESVKCLIFSLIFSLTCLLFLGFHPGEFSDLFLDACPRM